MYCSLFITLLPPVVLFPSFRSKMMPGKIGNLPIASENPLGLSWHDSAWIPLLNPTNIMDYFSERSNPFFDRTCNNEVVKMQRLSMDQLQNMTGLEYILLHVQDPILYVIRKQHRHGPSPNQVIPLADYYIIAGIVYQAPDLASVLNSRLLSAVHHLQGSFEETMSYSRYHPSKGYWWDFKPNKPGMSPFSTNLGSAPKEVVTAPKEEPSTLFQRQRVDMLLAELVRQFPLPTPNAAQSNGVTVKTENTNEKSEKSADNSTVAGVTIKQEPVDTNNSEMTNGNIQGHVEIKTEIKQENMKPPPEKKPRIM